MKTIEGRPTTAGAKRKSREPMVASLDDQITTTARQQLANKLTVTSR
jgi:hypothetical protein